VGMMCEPFLIGISRFSGSSKASAVWARLGVSTMRPEQREVLRKALITLFRQGYQTGRRDALGARALAVPTGVVESQIDGDFNGWEGETIVKLMNSQDGTLRNIRSGYRISLL